MAGSIIDSWRVVGIWNGKSPLINPPPTTSPFQTSSHLRVWSAGACIWQISGAHSAAARTYQVKRTLTVRVVIDGRTRFEVLRGEGTRQGSRGVVVVVAGSDHRLGTHQQPTTHCAVGRSYRSIYRTAEDNYPWGQPTNLGCHSDSVHEALRGAHVAGDLASNSRPTKTSTRVPPVRTAEPVSSSQTLGGTARMACPVLATLTVPPIRKTLAAQGVAGW
jgi:hypothetical protein